MYLPSDFNYQSWRNSGSYDSNYYYQLLEYIDKWFKLSWMPSKPIYTDWLRISDKAKKDADKFTYHLIWHEVNLELHGARAAIPLRHIDELNYRILVDSLVTPGWFKIRIDKASEELFTKAASTWNYTARVQP